MFGDRLTIWDRLEFRAGKGQTSAQLNLYRNQQEALRKEHLVVQEISPVADYPGEYLCTVDWSSAPDTTTCFAHRLFHLAVQNNPELFYQVNADRLENTGAPRPYEV